MGSHRPLGHSRFFSLAGHGIGIRVAAVGKLEHQLISVGRCPRFRCCDDLPIFLVGFFNRAVVHQLDTHSVKVGMARDFLVLSVGFDADRGDASLAVVHTVL